MNFGKLGFGFLRLPHGDDPCDVDLELTKQMVDRFLERGFRYFDTAYTYLGGKSEEALRLTLVERYPRQDFMIADKLPCGALRSGRTAEDIFAEQLQRCGVEWFDVYLLHGLDGEDAAFAEEAGCFDFLKELKRTGKANCIGFSFHDTADVLDGILTRHPEMDVVQIQLNYLDFENAIIQSRACWEVCRKHGKPVIVMEPVKGGTLAAVPKAAEALFCGEQPAHRALRFAASCEGVALVLSGMSTLEQVEENTSVMSPFKPLTAAETKVLETAAEIIRSAVAIPCTGCCYCTAKCPAGIPIPQYFSLYNERKRDGWQVNAEDRYSALLAKYPPAKNCISCGNCEENCPQKLEIPKLLKQVSNLFDKPDHCR
ncbi:MAG: aldo/keto reductase [Oscillospiraceae bacterium]|nr:aldo/keto reductase [Oscillospiraceae bacterium]